MRIGWVLLALSACGGPMARSLSDAADAGVIAAGDAGADAGVPPSQRGPSLAGCPVFPLENAWNRDVSSEPIDPHSADYLAFMGAGSLQLHPDFGGPYGQPFVVVPADQARVPVSFLYASQSEPGPYPFPANVPIQANEDRHATVLVRDECRIYETYNTYASGSGFRADSGAIFDLVSGAPRPDGWTSATAAGLPILPGLARYDEAVEQGEIRHALAFTAGGTAHAYVAPATHSSGSTNAAYAPPMGLRVRLRADFDLSPFNGASLAILRALQKYGMFCALVDLRYGPTENGARERLRSGAARNRAQRTVVVLNGRADVPIV
ncbi:MAG: hypothetical protein E6J63_21760 [Deltaproteobacteria bacterium]|nr:MAG: hypothetical protein E6J63_21760 [Deltaproteobacteria bacterium]